MNTTLVNVLFVGGIGQLLILFASALVPIRLNWRETLKDLPLLLRQLYWVYGGYVVLSIIAMGVICLTCAAELSTGSALARAYCLYGMVFWGVRLSLQLVLASEPYLTNWWLRCGDHLLTFLFASFVVIYGWGAFH